MARNQNIGELELWIPTLHPGQEMVLREAKKTNVLCAHRGWWKSSLAIQLAVRHLATGQDMGWYASTMNHIEDNWSLLKKVTRNVPNAIEWFNQSKHTFTMPGGGTCFFYSLEIPDNARGPSYPLVIGEEAGTWPDDIFESIVEPIAQKVQGDVWLIGTPNTYKPNNWFYKQVVQASDWPDYMKSWVIPARGAMFINEEIICNASSMSAYSNPYAPFPTDAHMQMMYAKADRKRKWRVEYLCDWISDEGGQFENIDNVCSLNDYTKQGSAYILKPYDTIEGRRNGHFQIGVDIGLTKDSTVICVIDRNTNCQVYFDRFCPGSTMGFGMVYDAIVRAIDLFPGICNVDCTGSGTGAEFELSQRGRAITPIKFNQNKVPLLDNLSAMIAGNKIKLFNLEVIKSELKTMQRSMIGTNKLVIQATKGDHDDIPMALCLMTKDIRTMMVEIATKSTLDHLINSSPKSEWQNVIW